MDEALYRAWWRLSRLPRVGNVAMNRLRQRLEQPENILTMTEDDWAQSGMKPPLVERWHNDPALDRGFEQLLQWQNIDHQGVLLAGWQQYPNALAALDDAPVFLFWRGQGSVASLDQPAIALVGSRNPSPAAMEWSHQQASRLKNAGYSIVSGMALGIDAAAHWGALEPGMNAEGERPKLFDQPLSNGTDSSTSHQGALVSDARLATVAVLGCGADVIYPKRHKELAARILEQGLILSEFLPGTAAQAAHFPSRNRIISGLTQATVVVEAAVKSGSLITAKMAAAQGREVMAVPGAVNNPLSRGCHQLIREGATLVESAEQVIEALEGFQPHRESVPHRQRHRQHPLAQSPAKPESSNTTKPEYQRESSSAGSRVPDSTTKPQQPTELTADGTSSLLNSGPSRSFESNRALLEHLDYSLTSVDQLSIRSGLAVQQILVALMELELEGLIQQEPGGYRRL